ncbi:MAG TPA: hypothetical protein VGK17_03005 [Propionicimonas sp.]|jgi:hypothetical protein
MPGTIATAVAIAKTIANGDFGYSQGDRWSGYQNGRLHQPGAFDCSSSTGVIFKMAGYPVDLTGTFYTGNIASRLVAAGFTLVRASGKSLAWLTKNVVAGSALVGPGHVVVGIGGGKIVSFESDERGKESGGKPGDQTGNEGRIRDLYMRPRGWVSLLLPPAEPKPPAIVEPIKVVMASQESPRFGGSTNYAARGTELATTGAGVIGLTETTPEMRKAILAALGASWRMFVHVDGAVALAYDSALFASSGIRQKSHGDHYHGAICVPLRDRAGKGRDFIVNHTRPRDAFGKHATDAAVAKGKREDVLRAVSLVGRWPAIAMGDWAMDPDEILATRAFVRITPDADSYHDGPGHMDAIYAQKGRVTAINGELVPATTSDHDRPTVTIN